MSKLETAQTHNANLTGYGDGLNEVSKARYQAERETTIETGLTTLLFPYVGENGKTENAIEVLERLLEELKSYRKLSKEDPHE